MKKKLIPKHQKGKKILNWLGNQFIKFGNAQIAGDSGVGTAMATASGYAYNKDSGRWELSEERLNDPAVKALRDNLAVLSTFSPTHPSTVILEKAVIPGLGYIGGKVLNPILNEIPAVRNYRAAKVISNNIDDVIVSEVLLETTPHPTNTITTSTTPAVQTGSNNKLWDRFRIRVSERPSYLSEAERMGIPKGERNLVHNPKLLQLNMEGSFNGELVDEIPNLYEDVFGEYLGSGANKHTFVSALNPNKVLKIHIKGGVHPDEDLMVRSVLPTQSHNKAPFYMKTLYRGYILDKWNRYPIYEQSRVSNILNPDDFDPIAIRSQFESLGYTPDPNFLKHYTPEGLRDATRDGLRFISKDGSRGYGDLRPFNMTQGNDGRFWVFDMDRLKFF